MKRILILLVPLLLTACMANQSKVESDLKDMLRKFEAVVRWGDLRQMYAFMKPPTDGKPVEFPEGLESIRVISYEAASRPAETKPGFWTHSAYIEYVHKDRQVVKGVVSHQVWEHDEENKRWYLVTPPPEFH